ncbi:hypothetical protein [Cohnella abietis]|uniref:Uncharacterized protein n=1 Tax=Cohnella abietis TaxID=2507935 RepID=A0A3T1D087_9BACL|nr:hypothetical protein [Cohnella abietis]BBI31510.1 hypothetical protein KCTCHS21_09090 [Cohnella abietis]
MANIIRKKFVLVFLLFVLVATTLYFYDDKPQSTQNENVANINAPSDDFTKRVGNIHGLLEVLPFNEMVKKSDKIVKVKINSKLKEINEPSAKTIFEAEVINDIYSKDNDGIRKINIMQAGNSQWSFNNNPLFAPGDVYVLFLKKTVKFDLENTYWLIGEETSVFEQVDSNTLIKWSHPEPELGSISDQKLIDKWVEKDERFNKDIQTVTESDLLEITNKILGQEEKK